MTLYRQTEIEMQVSEVVDLVCQKSGTLLDDNPIVKKYEDQYKSIYIIAHSDFAKYDFGSIIDDINNSIIKRHAVKNTPDTIMLVVGLGLEEGVDGSFIGFGNTIPGIGLGAIRIHTKLLDPKYEQALYYTMLHELTHFVYDIFYTTEEEREHFSSSYVDGGDALAPILGREFSFQEYVEQFNQYTMNSVERIVVEVFQDFFKLDEIQAQFLSHDLLSNFAKALQFAPVRSRDIKTKCFNAMAKYAKPETFTYVKFNLKKEANIRM